MSEDDDFYFRIQEEVIDEILKELPYMKMAFHNPNFDLQKSVQNSADFFLGAIFGEIIDRTSCRFLVRNVLKPSESQIDKLNYRLFTKAPEFRKKVMETVGI
jgi:hypothetical protein